MTDFIHYTEAWQIIKDNIPDSEIIEKSLADCLGYYTAADVFAPFDYPLFDNSAMDGFGFAFHELKTDTFFPINGVIAAGSSDLPDFKPGHASRIFTGAPVPEWMDVVIPKEQCEVLHNEVKIVSDLLVKGANIRPKASQTKTGDLILPAGTKIHAGIIGYLAAFGISKLSVYVYPEIGVLVTGDELVSPGSDPKTGQVFESNSTALLALLRENGIQPLFIKKVPDTLNILTSEIEDALPWCDVLLITGGISVGDYDYVQDALHTNGVQKLFYKIRQRPGKPMYVGKKDKTLVFALPGNPASVFTCFQVYVKPMLRSFISGGKDYTFLEEATMSHDFSKKKGLTFFFKSHVTDNTITILGGQESYKMESFVSANALVILGEETEEISRGENVFYIKI